MKKSRNTYINVNLVNELKSVTKESEWNNPPIYLAQELRCIYWATYR
jgi:hypothetical protein